MRVRVLRDGVYNNPQHKAQEARAGDIIEVAGGWYALSLAADGYVERVDEDGPEETVETGPSEASTPGPEETPASVLTQIKGIGPGMAQRLGELGIWSLGDLAAADPAALADALSGVSAKRAREWVEQARDLVG